MALKSLPPRLGPARSRSSATSRQDAEAERLRERDRSVKWRAWYKTERWRRLREEVLIRDGYVCQQTGVICSGKYPAPHSPVVDHKTPHRGNETLFWDINNLQTVSKEYHDAVKQKQERAQSRGLLDF